MWYFLKWFVRVSPLASVKSPARITHVSSNFDLDVAPRCPPCVTPDTQPKLSNDGLSVLNYCNVFMAPISGLHAPTKLRHREQEGHLDASSGRRSPNLTPAKDRATPPKNEPIVSGGTLPTIGGVKDQESMQQPAQVSDNASPIQRVQDGSGSHLTLEAATVAIPTATCVESLARFSRFLALLVVTPEEDANTLATTDREREALEELLRAR